MNHNEKLIIDYILNRANASDEMKNAKQNFSNEQMKTFIEFTNIENIIDYNDEKLNVIDTDIDELIERIIITFDELIEEK